MAEKEVKPFRTVEEILTEISPYYQKKKKLKNEKKISSIAEAEHQLVYESSSETLEPVYFFLLDFMKENLGLTIEKIYDNFTASPGSGHFSEMNQKMTIMQQQASKIMSDIFLVIKTILNIIYDLKEFKIRLESYKQLKDKDPNRSQSARLALKQIWMDKVDIQKGNSSIKGMALGQAGFATLLDAFLVVKNESLKDEKGNIIDLNDRVKRIVQQRIAEFNLWLEQSEQELKKRYEIQRNYLKTQVSSLRLYSRWVKPYLKAATDMEQKDQGRNPAMVKTFNTVFLELTLLGTGKPLDVYSLAREGKLPKNFKHLKLKRNYFPCLLVELQFRGIPQKVGQHYLFGGKVEVTFKGYALNNDEKKKLDEEINKSDIEDLMKIIGDISGENLKAIQEEIEYFIDDKKAEDEKKEKKQTEQEDESNPFLALIGWYNKPKEKEEKKDNKETKDKPIEKDSWLEEKHLRPIVAEDISKKTYLILDIYKKAHGMSSFT